MIFSFLFIFNLETASSVNFAFCIDMLRNFQEQKEKSLNSFQIQKILQAPFALKDTDR